MALKKAYPQRRMNPILYLIFLSPRQGFRVAEWHSGARCATALSLLALSTSPHNVAPTVRRTREEGARQCGPCGQQLILFFFSEGVRGRITCFNSVFPIDNNSSALLFQRERSCVSLCFEYCDCIHVFRAGNWSNRRYFYSITQVFNNEEEQRG